MSGYRIGELMVQGGLTLVGLGLWVVAAWALLKKPKAGQPSAGTAERVVAALFGLLGAAVVGYAWLVM